MTKTATDYGYMVCKRYIIQCCGIVNEVYAGMPSAEVRSGLFFSLLNSLAIYSNLLNSSLLSNSDRHGVFVHVFDMLVMQSTGRMVSQPVSRLEQDESAIQFPAAASNTANSRNRDEENGQTSKKGVTPRNAKVSEQWVGSERHTST